MKASFWLCCAGNCVPVTSVASFSCHAVSRCAANLGSDPAALLWSSNLQSSLPKTSLPVQSGCSDFDLKGTAQYSFYPAGGPLCTSVTPVALHLTVFLETVLRWTVDVSAGCPASEVCHIFVLSNVKGPTTHLLTDCIFSAGCKHRDKLAVFRGAGDFFFFANQGRC